MDGALTGNSLALLHSSTLKLFTAAEEGFLLYGTEPALEMSIKMHASLRMWPAGHSIIFPSVAPRARSDVFLPLVRERWEKEGHRQDMKSGRGLEEKSVSKKQHHCSSPQMFLVIFWKGLLEKKRCRKVFHLTYFMN